MAARYPATVPLDMSEDALQDLAMRYLHDQGWLRQHQRPARTAEGWRTAISGDTGAPDILAARDGDVRLIEVKSEIGRLRPEQKYWLEHGRAFVLRPSRWADFVESFR